LGGRRSPPGQCSTPGCLALIRVHGFELERTIKTLSAPWDRRVLPVATGEAVSIAIAESQPPSAYATPKGG
jgi:hypothetical protein